MNEFCASLKSIGRYQWFLIVMLAFNGIGSWQNYGIILMAPKVDYTCVDYGFNLTRACHVNISEMEIFSEGETPNPVYSLQQNSSNSIQKCRNFEYDHSQFEWTVTEKFELICDRDWLIGLTKSMYYVGYLIGSLGPGMLSDLYGRKKIIIAALLLGFIGNITSAFTPWFWLYAVSRIFLGFSEMSLWLGYMVLTLETIRKDHRAVAKATDSAASDLAFGILGGVAFVLNNHVYIHLIIASCLALVLLVTVFSVEESPRWLISQKREPQAKKIVEKITKYNRCETEELSFLMQSADTEQRGKLYDLVRTPLIRKRFLVLITWYVLLVPVVYAIALNLGDFSQDVRISCIILGLSEVFMAPPMVYAITKFGRTVTIFTNLIFAAVGCLTMAPLIIYYPDGHWSLQALAIACKLATGNIFLIMYLFVAELLPTVVRTTGIGACSTAARITTMLAPQLALLNHFWPALMVVLLGIICLLTSLLVPLVPDTTNVELPQTIADGENLFPEHRYSLRKARPVRLRRVEVSEANGVLLVDKPAEA